VFQTSLTNGLPFQHRAVLPIPVATAVLFWVIYRSLQPAHGWRKAMNTVPAPLGATIARFAAGVLRPGPQPVSVVIDRSPSGRPLSGIHGIILVGLLLCCR
jgi:hypothetical protein